MMSNSGSPIKTTSTTATAMVAPPRQSSASIDTTHTRYVEKFVQSSFSNQEEAADVWQILTTTPDHIQVKIAELNGLLVGLSDVIKHDDIIKMMEGPENREIRMTFNNAKSYYKNIVKNIDASLFGDHGVYCSLTRRGDIKNQTKYTPHVGLTALVEKSTGERFGG